MMVPSVTLSAFLTLSSEAASFEFCHKTFSYKVHHVLWLLMNNRFLPLRLQTDNVLMLSVKRQDPEYNHITSQK
jgi:hypothetical protein